MNKLKLEYTCTDPDCSQCRAKISNTRYSFIEYREWFGKYIVCHAVVDLQDYSLDEIYGYCSAYCCKSDISVDRIIEDYGFREALAIMAECIFESLSFDEMEFNSEQRSEGAAIKFIHEWMEG